MRPFTNGSIQMQTEAAHFIITFAAGEKKAGFRDIE